MNAEAIEQELDLHLKTQGYQVRLKYFVFLTGEVTYQGKVIGEKNFMVDTLNYWRASRWSLKTIRKHQRAMARVAGIDVQNV